MQTHSKVLSMSNVIDLTIDDDDDDVTNHDEERPDSNSSMKV